VIEMKKRIMLSLIAIVSVALIAIFAGCVDEKTPSKMTTLHIGYQPSNHQIAAMLASEKGWWEEDLAKFDLDVAYVGVSPPIAAMYEGLDAKIVAGSLKGMTIATFPPGSIQHTILSKWLLDNGIDPEKDVDMKAMGPSDAITAIGAKTVDAVFLPSPSPTIIVEEGNGVIVEWSGSMWKDHACCCLTASGKMIREHPEIVKEIIKTHIRATEYEIEHPEEAAEICAKWLDADVKTIQKSIDATDMQWISDPHLEVESGLEYARVIYELNKERYEGKGIKVLEKEDVFDTSFYDETKG